MFVDLDRPLNASSLLSASAELLVPSVLVTHYWLGDMKGIRPVTDVGLWWWWFEWSFARLVAAVVTTTYIILSCNKLQNGEDLILAYMVCPEKMVNNNNNNRISIVAYGRNFRGAGGRSDQCWVKAWLKRKSRFKTSQRITDENCLWQRVPDSRCWRPESTLREVVLNECCGLNGMLMPFGVLTYGGREAGLNCLGTCCLSWSFTNDLLPVCVYRTLFTLLWCDW